MDGSLTDTIYAEWQTDMMELNVVFLLFVGTRQITRAGNWEW